MGRRKPGVRPRNELVTSYISRVTTMAAIELLPISNTRGVYVLRVNMGAIHFSANVGFTAGTTPFLASASMSLRFKK